MKTSGSGSSGRTDRPRCSRDRHPELTLFYERLGFAVESRFLSDDFPHLRKLWCRREQ